MPLSSLRRRGIWRWGLLGVMLLGGVWISVIAFSPARPNILLITLDTTRADRLGCYGHAAASTPTIDALAAEGVMFQRAYTPVPLTLPAHASMLTGYLPPEHGLITNGRGSLPKDVKTLAEQLRDVGYDTAAFVSSFVLHSKFGLQRGFTVYDDDMTHTHTTEHGLHRQREGSQVTELAQRWLGQTHRRPFFCWVHFYDAHHPYLAHADEFGERFSASPYDGEIAYVDLQIQKLLKTLDDRQLRRETIVIVVGDHGESLGEHQEEEHSLTVYDATMRIPWVWSGPGISPPGQPVSAAVSLVDLAPTLRELTGLRAVADQRGRSLAPIFRGERLVDQAWYGGSDDPLFELGCAPVRCLANAEWKYIRSTEPELYDLVTDPQEIKNLAAGFPEKVAEWESRLRQFEQSLVRRTGAEVQLSPRERRALESLGYLGEQREGAESTSDDAPRPDLKRILPLANVVTRAKLLQHAGQAKEAETWLRKLTADNPTWEDGHLALAENLLAQSQFDECEKILAKLLSMSSENYKIYFQLGLIDVARGERSQAIERFRQALLHKPDAVGVLYNLGLNLLQTNQLDEARRYFEETLDADPTYAQAHVGLGMVMTRTQQFESAVSQYQTALSFDADSLEAHTNLAVLLLGLRRTLEAETHFVRAAQLAPENAETRCNLGTYYLTIGKVQDAITELTAALAHNPDHAAAKSRLEQARQLSGKR